MTEENVNIEDNKEETAEGSVETPAIVEDDANSPFKWYAVRIVSGHENKVKLYLENEIRAEGLEERIKHVVIPYEKVYEVKNGKKKIKLKNFLPGYILINADLNDSIRDFIAKTPSIINMVGVKKGKKLEAIPLSHAEVKRIQALLSEESATEKIDINFNVGDAVKVTSGPFNNFNGNILEINPEKMKVKVMVSIFGRKTPIELELTQIERE
jgi:transcriptional antiterminator NusG